VLLPKFKLAFLLADRRPHLKQMLIEYVKRVHAKMSGTHASASSLPPAQSAGDTDKDDDLYSFLKADNSETTNEESTVVQQVLLHCFVCCRPTIMSSK